MAFRSNYRLGATYAAATALMFSTQEPFSALAARRLDGAQFVFVTQVALLLSIPLLNGRARARRDVIAILKNRALYGKLAVIFAIGLMGLLLYKFGLAGAHPILIAAILNLSPFWAALVARGLGDVPIPLGPLAFFGCLAAAFLGAMAVAWSQLAQAPGADLLASLARGTWVFAVPVPIFTALSGALVGRWFADYEESAAIGVNFLIPAALLIPSLGLWLAAHGRLSFDEGEAVALLIAGTLIAGAAGRLFYQLALTAAGYDNGYVTMFFLLVPPLTALVSLPLSLAIPEVRVFLNWPFFVGMALISAALAAFSLQSWRDEAARAAES